VNQNSKTIVPIKKQILLALALCMLMHSASAKLLVNVLDKDSRPLANIVVELVVDGLATTPLETKSDNDSFVGIVSAQPPTASMQQIE